MRGGGHAEYFHEVVYLRAMAILSVISIHLSGYFWTMDTVSFLTFLYLSIDAFSHFAVPLFVCISGFVLFNGYSGAFPVRAFYRRRLLSVVPPYLVFTTIALLLSYAQHVFRGEAWDVTVPGLVYRYVTADADFYLWFFLLIIELYLLYPVILRVFLRFDAAGRSWLLLGIAFAIQIPFYLFDVVEVFFAGRLLLFSGYLFYFVLGMFARSRYDRQRHDEFLRRPSNRLFAGLVFATTLGIASLAREYIQTGLPEQIATGIHSLFVSVVAPLYYLAIFSVAVFLAVHFTRSHKNRFVRILYLIGTYSFAIYLVHMVILRLLGSLVFDPIGFDANSWLFFPIGFALVLGLSLLTVSAVRRLPYSEYLIGATR